MAIDTDIRQALRTVIDPELGVNIVDLGLVYRTEVEGPRVRVEMTMTSPACPMGDYVKKLVDAAIRGAVAGVQQVDVVLVWEPAWDPDMMSDAARQQLDGGAPR
jgi:metal-sulfur cluster biosynthetic enzyme